MGSTFDESSYLRGGVAQTSCQELTMALTDGDYWKRLTAMCCSVRTIFRGEGVSSIVSWLGKLACLLALVEFWKHLGVAKFSCSLQGELRFKGVLGVPMCF